MSSPHESETATIDVCIVGAGPAGLSVAVGLLGSGLRVTVLEAGDESASGPLDVLGHVEVVGDDAYPQSSVDVTRGTGLGGTARRWSFRMSGSDALAGERGCRYAPLDALDLEPDPARPHTGWPLRHAALSDWYAAAHRVAELGPVDGDVARWGDAPLDLSAYDVGAGVFQFGPASAFTERAVRRLRADPLVSVLTGAVATSVVLDETSRDAAGVRVVIAGSERLVRARRVVLAAGGIENSRLLLLSDAARIGNQHDQVGRFFMEHPLVRGGIVEVPAGARVRDRLRLYDAAPRRGTVAMAKLTVSDERVRADRLVSTAALLIGLPATAASPGVQAVRALRSPTVRASSRATQLRLLLRAVRGAADVVRAHRARGRNPGLDGYGWTAADAPEPVALELLLQTEQSPHPDNRVLLGASVDRYGRRQAVLHWRWSDDDRSAVTRARDRYAAALQAADIGVLTSGDWDAGHPRRVAGTHHHMGGTRMSLDPRDGVVDTDCQVHGTIGLFVAGSSTFPTGGSVNPTLTIVALALRLAHHLGGSGPAGQQDVPPA